MVSKIATLKDRNGNKLLPRTVFEAVQSNSGNTLDSALNQFISWKELQMNSDGTFPPTKCADWYSDKIYIEGQTVKNIIVQTDVRAEENRLIIYNLFGNRIPSNGYSIKNTTSKRIIVSLSDINTGKWVKEIPLVSKEIKNLTDDLYISSITGLFSNGWTTKDADKTELINTFFAVETDKIDSVSKSIPFGLNSLGDTKDGRTYISLGDTKDGRTYISLTSNGYENKIEVTEPLRKVGNVADVIDENVLTRNIGEESINSYVGKTTYNNNIHWILLKAGAIKLNSTGIKVISEKLQVVNSGYDSIENQGKLYINDDGSLRYMTNLTTSDISDVYPINIQYQLATPTVEQVKSTFVYTPNQNGECSFKFNNAVVPSNSKLSVAQTTQLLLNDKLDKTDVVNTKTETVLGKALDATQNNPNVGGSLANQIGVLPTLKTTNKEDLVKAINENVDDVKYLNEDRGYLNTRWKEANTDWNKVTENGIYRMNTWESMLNAPSVEKFGHLGDSSCAVNRSGHTVTQLTIGTSNTLGSVILYRVGESVGQSEENWKEWSCDSDKITALQGATVGLGFSSSCVDLNSKNITDVHNLITTSYRRCFGNDLINAPSTGFYFYDIKVHSTGFATITAQGFGYGGAIKATFTKECLGGEWQKWERQATTDKIDISFPYASGLTDEGQYWKSTLTKTDLDVEFVLNCKPTSGNFISGSVTLGDLPVGYRPSKNIAITAWGTGNIVCKLYIYASGTCTVYIPSNNVASINTCIKFDLG